LRRARARMRFRSSSGGGAQGFTRLNEPGSGTQAIISIGCDSVVA
jgi:hypothetical protein